jgi:hypothetical protein
VTESDLSIQQGRGPLFPFRGDFNLSNVRKITGICAAAGGTRSPSAWKACPEVTLHPKSGSSQNFAEDFSPPVYSQSTSHAQPFTIPRPLNPSEVPLAKRVVKSLLSMKMYEEPKKKTCGRDRFQGQEAV